MGQPSGEGAPQRRDPGAVFTLALASISVMGPLAVHTFLPALPPVKTYFGITDAKAQLTFSVALFTMAFATLFYGSLSDRYGRRPVLLSGLAFFLCGSAICALAPTIEILLAGRVVQAIGAGCGVTLVRTIARDAYGADRLVRAIAYLTMFYTLGPMVAPLIGGFLVDAYGWRSVFYISLATGALVALGAWAVVYETRPPEEAAVAARSSMLRGYVELFSHWRFVCFVLQTGFSTGVFFTMASSAAPLMKEALGRSAGEFGVWFLLFPIGYFCGNFISARIANRASIETMVLIGSVLGVLTTVVQSAFLLAGWLNPWTLFIPGLCITFAQGLALPFSQTGAMATIPRLTGTASGVGVFMQNFLSGVCTIIYGLLADGTARPLIIVILAASLIVLVVGAAPFFGRKRDGERLSATR